MKRLLIDINSIIPYYTVGVVTGIGRSTLELLKALSKVEDIPFEIVLFSQNTRGVKAKKDFSFKYLHFYMPYRKFFKKISSILQLKRWFCRYDLIHMPNNTDLEENERKVIYTIHDLIVCRYPEMWGVENDLSFFVKLKFSLRNCKAIVTCSESSKRDIIDFSGVPEDKVISIPWGIDREKFRSVKKSDFIKRVGISSLYYFSASCNHPRKNLSLILQAYRDYYEKGGVGQLVLLNQNTAEMIGFEDLMRSKRIIVCRCISDEELVELYSHAQCSIIVSEYEGFGFPVLESLACHTMVLSAANSSLVEAGGNVVDYVESLSVEAISRKMLKYDKKEKYETIDIKKIESHLNNFTWEKCAERYINFYRKQLSI